MKTRSRLSMPLERAAKAAADLPSTKYPLTTLLQN